MIPKRQYTALSNFRSSLAHFLRFSERASRSAGITPTQYLLMLHIRGFPDRDWATVGELATLLHRNPNGTAALISRCVRARLVVKNRSRDDARSVQVHLTSRGAKVVERVAARHREELRSLQNVFRVADIA
jgi:DNA-binding MarR family transcriptional regulator